MKIEKMSKVVFLVDYEYKNPSNPGTFMKGHECTVVDTGFFGLDYCTMVLIDSDPSIWVPEAVLGLKKVHGDLVGVIDNHPVWNPIIPMPPVTKQELDKDLEKIKNDIKNFRAKDPKYKKPNIGFKIKSVFDMEDGDTGIITRWDAEPDMVNVVVKREGADIVDVTFGILNIKDFFRKGNLLFYHKDKHLVFIIENCLPAGDKKELNQVNL